ncbi:hypothetical protein N431DRAFT_492117 [Stipitochalara longipes BDJ]|nr:hypothetical protein N431DRAFT_492117 [Stipitochalara longipes BDJ]
MNPAKRNGNRESYRINFCELQRMHLRQLQYKLVDHVVNLTYGGKEPSGWAEDLRNYEPAASHTILPSRDPFYVTGERIVDRCMLNAAMRGKENPDDPLRLTQSIGQWETGNFRPEPVGGTRDENFQRAWITAFHQRVGAAVVGGIFLIGPMWLMVLHKTRYTALISTTVFVTAFGLMMALFLDQKMDVLSSTAAYAAVLVVFVGLNT